MGIEYSSDNIINIYTGEVLSYDGTYSRSGKRLILGKNSWISFRKVFSATDNALVTDSIQVLFDASISDNSITSRYNCNIKANIKIQYYSTYQTEEGITEYTDGPYRTFCITPYLKSETDGKIETYTIETQNIPIKKLEIYIFNTNNSEISIDDFGIYNSLNLTESLGKGLVIEVTLQKFEFHNNGIKVKFSTGDLDLKALKNTETNKFAGYNVNDKSVILSEDINSDL